VTTPSTRFLKVSLVDRVVETLHDRIAQGSIVPGETLRIESLAREFGVSRTPVREAISKLEAQGIVVRRTGYAATVFAPLRKEVLEYYEMRMVLEPLAARLALPEVTPAALEKLEALVDAMDDFEASDWFVLNRDFHHELYSAGERLYLLESIDNLIVRSDPYIRIYFEGHDLEETQRGHRRILEAVTRSDADELERAVADHLQHVVTGILEVIDDDEREREA
jgi:DNA-binding GntR family transcriptional regulator